MKRPAPTLISIAAFLKRHAPALRKAPRVQLLQFVLWYWTDARVGIIRENGRIVAVAMARCMNDVTHHAEPYHHDEAGKIVWVEHIVSRHPAGITMLLQQVRERFGPREAFAGHVFHRDGELRMLPMKVVERLTTGTPQHVNHTTTGTAAA